MPATYAHIMIVKSLAHSSILDSKNFPESAITAILDNIAFAELGAISPDYPYLGGGKLWADNMHYRETGEIIKNGISRLKAVKDDTLFTWLLGYAAHVITDITIHPIVEKKVGDYDSHPKEHRICEMNQDVYIHQQIMGCALQNSEVLKNLLSYCSEGDRLNTKISCFWATILKDTYPGDYHRNQPEIDKWHNGFRFAVAKIASTNCCPIRETAEKAGLVYSKKPDMTYIDSLATPLNTVINYDTAFERARENVIDKWLEIAQAVYANDMDYLASIKNWNLDTGKITGTTQSEYWEA